MWLQMWLQDVIYNHEVVNIFLDIILNISSISPANLAYVSTSGLFLSSINACAVSWPALPVRAVQVTDTNQLCCRLLWTPVPQGRCV